MMKDIIDVAHVGDLKLLLTFEGGERREIDIGALLPLDGVFAPLRDPGFFGRVRVEREIGTIVWPNGADLCPDVLYERSRLVQGGSASVA